MASSALASTRCNSKCRLFVSFLKLLLVLALALVVCRVDGVSIHIRVGSKASRVSTSTAISSTVRLVNIWPHNASAFTEGFFIENGFLYESTGLPQQSFIRVSSLDDMLTSHQVDAQGPPLNQSFRFPDQFFGEGITAIGDKLFALTYKAKKLLVVDRQELTLLETHDLATSTGEGWGMTTDGKHLIVSDGSSNIQFFDPKQGFNCTRTISVHERQQGASHPNQTNVKTIQNVNELEYVDGQILANVWHTNNVLRINAETGQVIETIELDWLPSLVTNLDTMPDEHLKQEAVMNGIAFHPESRHVFVTGKMWDSMFELELSTLIKVDD